MGFRPYFFTASPEARTMAAAPSLIPEALPAVTRLPGVPSARGNAPRSLASLASSVSFFGNSSTLNSTISLFFLIMTGTISSLNRPEACAAAAFCWEASAKASSSSRVRPYWSQTFSAVVPMW